MPPVLSSPTLHWPRASWAQRLRSICLCLALTSAFAVFVWQLDKHIPLNVWLFWRYAKYWLAVGGWSTSVLAFGHVVVSRLSLGVKGLEHLVLSFAVGFLGFYWLQFLVGWFGLYGFWWFYLVPAVQFAVSVPFLIRDYPRWELRRRLAPVSVPARSWSSMALSYALIAYGVIALTGVYINSLTPENIAFDARWYHLAMAEQYALAGRIIRFREGWFMGAYPQLASYLYCWAFEMPGAQFFDKLQLSAHLEYVVFLWTLVGMVPLVRALVPGARANQAWVAVFLFPGIFLYDSSLAVGADHIAAFWAVPIVLALVRAWPSLDGRWCALVAAFVGGAISTKYSAISLFVFPVGAIVIRGTYLIGRHLWRREFGALRSCAGALLAAGISGVTITAPHWAKNWAFYGDPLYPMLTAYLPARPFVAGMEHRLQTFIELAWRPERSWAGVGQTLRALYRFSFVPNNWSWMHGAMPVFGSLFTLSILCLPFLPRRLPRLWSLYLGVHLGLFAWYWVAHEDRYLQALVPWMAASVAAVLIILWREMLMVRVAASALVGLQVVWGMFVYFIPTHGMVHQAPIKAVADMAASPFLGTQDQYLDPFSNYSDVGELVGRNAVLLLHEQPLRVGFGVRGVQDRAMHQGAIIYGSQGSYRDVYNILRQMKVTHLLWGDLPSESSLADDIVFRAFVKHWVGPITGIRSWSVAAMLPEAPPEKPFNTKVLVNACPQDGYAPGIHLLSKLYVLPLSKMSADQYPKPMRGIQPKDMNAEIAKTVGFIVWNRYCAGGLPEALREGAVQVGSKGDFELWERL